MNKFIKVCLSIVGIMMAFGLVLFTVGAMFGGIHQVVDITRRGGFNYTFSDGIIYLHGFDWDLDEYDEYYDNLEEYKDYEYNDLGDADDIDEVRIEIGACVLDVQVSEDNNYLVEAENVYHLKCKVKDGVLLIGSEQDTFPNFDKRHVTLYIPEDENLDNLDIRLGAGVGIVDSIKADAISIDVGAGELTGSDLKVNEANISVGAGSVTFRDCKFGEAKFNVGVGMAQYRGELTGDVEVDCGMGNVEMKLAGERDDFNYRLDCAMGQIEIDRSHFSGMGNRRRENNDANKTMDLDCSMGNIEIDFED